MLDIVIIHTGTLEEYYNEHTGIPASICIYVSVSFRRSRIAFSDIYFLKSAYGISIMIKA